MDPIVTDHVLINGTRIAHGMHGEGEPVVMLHGTPASSLIWRNVVPHLTRAGYKAHVFDLLGYGLSERPWDPDIDTSITGQVPILEGLLDHWGLETTHLVAHDFGGGVAQRFAVFSPERLRSLTMIDVVSFDSYPSRRTRQQMEEGLEAMVKASDADHRAHFREWLLSTVQNKQRLSEEALDIYLDYISGAIGQGSFFQHQMRHYDPKHTMEIADRLHELGKLPVKLIWGADDAWQVMDWAHRLNDAIPGSELSTVENCGHFAMEEQPEDIARLLLQFLERHT
jgi:pimeloyl-ACP methyl ester carboxylesterase